MEAICEAITRRSPAADPPPRATALNRLPFKFPVFTGEGSARAYFAGFERLCRRSGATDADMGDLLVGVVQGPAQEWLNTLGDAVGTASYSYLKKELLARYPEKPNEAIRRLEDLTCAVFEVEKFIKDFGTTSSLLGRDPDDPLIRRMFISALPKQYQSGVTTCNAMKDCRM